MPVLRLFRSMRDLTNAFFSPAFAYRRGLERFLSTNDSAGLKDFVGSRFSQSSYGHIRGSEAKATLLDSRIKKDYFQFLGTFSEALEHRIAFQEKVLLDWKSRLTRVGRRERHQISIEWMETPAISSSVSCKGPVEGSLLSQAVFNRIRTIAKARPRPTNKSDQLFFSAVRGKRVLVLGPGATDPLDQRFIESFDVLAVPKLHSGFWMKSLENSETAPTVVTYLNHKIVRAMQSSNSVTEKVWDFARVKSIDDARALATLYADVICEDSVIGVMKSPDHLLMNSYGPFMGTAMVFDLLLAHPATVFVMGFSFFAQDGQAYNSNYESASHTDQFTLASLRLHGAFSNFLFFRNLYHFGSIEADAKTSDILALGSREYADRLDGRFGLNRTSPP